MVDQKNECAFLGQYDINMDVKNRVSIPSKWRMKMGQEIVMYRNPDGIWSITRSDIFSVLCAGLLSKNEFDKNARKVRRLLLGTAREIELDKWSRFVIPGQFFESNGSDRELLLIGNGNYVEIWNKKAYEKWELEERDSYDYAAQQITSG